MALLDPAALLALLGLLVLKVLWVLLVQKKLAQVVLAALKAPKE